MFRKSISRQKLTRLLLAMIALGGFIGFILGCPTVKADSDYEAAQVVCAELSADNPNAAMDQLFVSLRAQGFKAADIGKVFVYDVYLGCPEKMAIFKAWTQAPMTTGVVA